MTHTPSTSQQLAAEGIGTAFLLMAVVGSGIMGENLSQGNDALALLANSIATGCALAVLILVFAPLSGAHFNPAVTLSMAFARRIAPRTALLYIAVQCAAAVAGVMAAHLMFGVPVIEASQKIRTGSGQWFSEVVATFGLLVTIWGTLRRNPAATPYAVALYITAAYWFTASTSFANPAVTLARAFTDSFSGIQIGDVPAFVAAQLAGAMLATLFWR